MTTCQTAALESLQVLAGLWNGAVPFGGSDCGGGCFWMAGNAFHSAIKCLVGLGIPDTYSFGLTAQAFFSGIVKAQPNPADWGNQDTNPSNPNHGLGYWVDDYAWWGLAFADAFENADLLGYNSEFKTTLGQFAKNCWIAMNARWDCGAVPSYPSIPTVYPVVPIFGGIPNTTSAQQLAGKNCVTNASFWRLSQRLYKLFDDMTYIFPNEQAFFVQAINQYLLYQSAPGPDMALVLQCFAGMQQSNPNWVWLGDQGLLSACLFFEQYPVYLGSKPPYVVNLVLSQKIKNNQLYEDLAPPEVSNYWLDYACGKGTFMRYLAEVNNSIHNNSVPPWWWGGGVYDTQILNIAKGLWANRQAKGLFPFYWDISDQPSISWGYSTEVSNIVLHASGLSAISATLPWQKDTSID